MINATYSVNHRQRRATGFTLLEVLVALVVLSIGLLGLSGLQATSLRNNHAAFLRSQATILKNDIIDRMRANRDGATAGNYNIDYGQAPPDFDCGISCANASGVAKTDLLEWHAYVERLQGREGEINVDADGVAEVKICWGDTRPRLETTAACGEDGTEKLELVSRVQL